MAPSRFLYNNWNSSLTFIVFVQSNCNWHNPIEETLCSYITHLSSLSFPTYTSRLLNYSDHIPLIKPQQVLFDWEHLSEHFTSGRSKPTKSAHDRPPYNWHPTRITQTRTFHKQSKQYSGTKSGITACCSDAHSTNNCLRLHIVAWCCYAVLLASSSSSEANVPFFLYFIKTALSFCGDVLFRG